MKPGKSNPGLTHVKQLPHELGYRISSFVVDTGRILIDKLKPLLLNAIAQLNILGLKQWFKSSRLLIDFSGDSHVEGSRIEVSQSLSSLSP